MPRRSAPTASNGCVKRTTSPSSSTISARLRLVQLVVDVALDPLEQRPRRPGQGSRRHRHLIGAWGQHSQSRTQQRRQVAGHGELGVVSQPTNDLQREQWIPTRHLVEPHERRAPQRHAEPVDDRPMQRSDAQRSDLDALHRVAWESPGQRGDSVTVRPRRGEQADSLIAVHATQGRTSSAPRDGSVQPLRVIDRHHERAVGPQHAQRTQDRRRDDGRIARFCPGSSNSSTTASARRCGGGRAARTSVAASPTRSRSPANAS